MKPLNWKSRITNYRLMLICASVIILLDQATKWLVVKNIPFGTYLNPVPVPPFEGFLSLVHIGNKGAAWGMFQGFGNVLAVFAVITIAGIFLFRKMLGLHLKSMQIAFGLLIGGIIGNLYDRIAVGHVIDFIDVDLQFYRWPAFNVADSAICVGVFAYIFLSFRMESDKTKKEKKLNPSEVSQEN